MPATVQNLLSIYRVRCKCQRDGVTNPHPKIKQFCIELVQALEKEEPASIVLFEESSTGETDFVCEGRVLATLPADDEIRDWS